MYRQNSKTTDVKSLRTLAVVLGVAGLIILFRIPPFRMLGFVLIGAGAFSLIWSLVGSNRGNSNGAGRTREEEDHRRFFS